jgi:hypothetical protein
VRQFLFQTCQQRFLNLRSLLGRNEVDRIDLFKRLGGSVFVNMFPAWLGSLHVFLQA